MSPRPPIFLALRTLTVFPPFLLTGQTGTASALQIVIILIILLVLLVLYTVITVFTYHFISISQISFKLYIRSLSVTSWTDCLGRGRHIDLKLRNGGDDGSAVTPRQFCFGRGLLEEHISKEPALLPGCERIEESLLVPH